MSRKKGKNSTPGPKHLDHDPQLSLVIRPNSVPSPRYSSLSTQSSVLCPQSFCSFTQSSSLSPHHFLLRIADITISLLSDDPELSLEIEGATKKFLVPQADPAVRVQARWGDLCENHGGKKIFDSGVLWQLYSEDHSYRFHFTSPVLGPVPYKIASFNRKFTSGEVCFHHPYFSRSQPLYPLDYPLDELLLVNLLAQGRGVEVHACGVVDSAGNGDPR